MLTFNKGFTFSLSKSSKWLLSAVRPTPQTWHCRPGMIAGRAGCHEQRCANGRGGFVWSLLEAPPRRVAYKEDERTVFFQLVRDSQLVMAGCGSDRFESVSVSSCQIAASFSSSQMAASSVPVRRSLRQFQSDGCFIGSSQMVASSVPVRWLPHQFQSYGCFVGSSQTVASSVPVRWLVSWRQLRL